LAEHFPGVLRAMQQTGAPALAVANADPNVTSVGRGRLVWSSDPLYVDGAPVQRAVRIRGDFARPVNPLVDVALPRDPAAPVQIIGPKAAFTVTAVGAQDGVDQPLGDALVHQGTHPSTDTVARAINGGVETYELLRDTGAPEQFIYRVGGATPRVVAGGAIELVASNRVVGVVTAPVIVDAAGNAIPASLSVSGQDVVFTVRHRTSDTRYPVLADPLWTADYNFSLPDQGVGGLFTDDPGDHYNEAAVTGGARPGITILPFGGRTYAPGDGASVVFAAPPGSTIDRVDFRDVYRYNGLDRQTLRLGLYGPSTSMADDWSDNVVRSEASVVLDDPANAAKFALVRSFTPSCEVGESNCPRFISAATQTRVTVRQMVVTLVDPGAPAVGLSGSLTTLGSGWIRGTGTHDLGVSFTDDGTGVKEWQVRQVRGGAGTPLAGPETNTCDQRASDSSHEAFPCPQSDGFTDPEVDLAQLLEGHIQIVASAKDYVDNTNDGSGSTIDLRLDRTPPSVDSIGGALTGGPAGRWRQIRGAQPLQVETSDRYSGVRQFRATITPVSPAGTPDQQTIDTCTPLGTTEQPCPPSITTDVPIEADQLPDGELGISVEAEDYVGYTSPPSTARIFKDNGDPAATARGDLADLEDEWTGSDAQTSVTIQGKDRRSGVARLQLYARDEQGSRLVDDIAVCDPTTIDAAAGEACPLTASRTTNVDLGDLESGRVTLEAYAVDAAGNRDPSPESWSTYVDHDPPTEPGRVSAIASAGKTVRISWAPADDDESGIAGYEYRLSTDDRTTEWVTTPFPGVTVPQELEPTRIEVRAKDRTGNRGPSTSGQLPEPVAEQLSADGLTCPGAVAKTKGAYALSFGLVPDLETNPLKSFVSCVRKMNGNNSVTIRIIVPIDIYGLASGDYNTDGALKENPKDWRGNFDGLDQLPKSVGVHISFMAHSFKTGCSKPQLITRREMLAKAPNRPYLDDCQYPDEALYLAYLKRFKSRLRNVNVVAWSAWNEPNQPMFTVRRLGAKNGGRVVAGYWNALRRAGLGSSDVYPAGEIDFQHNANTWADSIKRQMNASASVWAVHDYKATVYGKASEATRHIASFGSQVWVTELGFQYHKYRSGNLPSAAVQAARARVYRDAGQRQGTLGSIGRVSRVFYYGADSAGGSAWDTALWDTADEPRPALCGIYRASTKYCKGNGQ
jgi:hypothetical protein